MRLFTPTGQHALLTVPQTLPKDPVQYFLEGWQVKNGSATSVLCPSSLNPLGAAAFWKQRKEKEKKEKKKLRNGVSETLSGELNPASSQDTAAQPRAPLAAPPGQPPRSPSQRCSPGPRPGSSRGPRASFSLFPALALLRAAVSFSHLKELLLFERRCASPREKPAQATQTEPPAALHWGQGHCGAQPQKQQGKGNVRLVAHGCAHGSVSLPGTSDPPGLPCLSRTEMFQEREKPGRATAPWKEPEGALALTGTSTAGSCGGECPCLQRTRARTTSFGSRPWVWRGQPRCWGAGREGEVMETIPGAFLHLSTGQGWSVAAG